MIVSRDELVKVKTASKRSTIALRFGSYDLLHAGHQRGIDFASSQADLLVLGVMPDRYLTKGKGPDRPIKSAEQRVESVDAARGVDYAFIAPIGSLALAGVFTKLCPDKYIEDETYGAPLLKSAFLRLLGIDYVIERKNWQDPTASLSTTEMIANLGLVQATAKSGLDFNYLE